MLRSLLIVGMAALLLYIPGCKGGGQSGTQSADAKKSGTDAPAMQIAMFKQDVQPIFSKICARPECHGAAKSAGMQLSEGMAYDNIVKVTSSEDAHFMRVAPGDPQNSYLVMKIEGRQTVGMRMPLTGGPLSEKEIGIIRSWIQAGAQNN